MIPKPGDTNREVPVNETFHVQTDDELTEKELKQIEADDQAIQTILLGLPEDIYAAIDSCETAQEIWLRVQQMMKGSDIGIQEKKANNIKFLNNLQPEWSRHVTIVHQTKDLHTADYTQLYDFLKYNQKEVDELKAKRLAKIQDPLALMANSNYPYAFLAPQQDQPSYNQNYMQQPMPNPEDITDPTTAMNMALALMAKAFNLNYSTTTREFHQTHAIGRLLNRNVGNLNGYNAVQNVRNQVAQNPRVQNVGNQNGLIGVLGNANLNGNGNLVAARAEGNAAGHNGNQIRCYNCRGVDLDEIEEVNANCILMANLQQASTSGTQSDKAPVYDSDGSAEVHDCENYDDNEIFYMFTQEEQYTELLEPIPEPHQVPQNDNNVISEGTSVEQSGETIEQHPANFEETHALYDSLYQNLAIEVEKVNSVNRKLKETNADLTTKQETLQLAQESREKMKQLNKEIKPANYTKINHLSGVFVSQTAKSREELYFSNDFKTANVPKTISIPNEEFSDDSTPIVARKFLNEVKSTIVTLQRVVKHRMTLETHKWLSSAHQELHKIVKDENFPIVNQVDARVQNFEIQFLKEAAKFVGDFKSLAKEADESLAKHKTLELEIERLLRAVFSQDIMFVVQKNSVVETSNLQNNTKTRRPQPRSNTKNDRVPSASKSIRSKNKGAELEEHHRNLLLSKNTKHMSAACNNIKLDSQNVISKVVCAMCKQCLISVNHNVCLRNYVNGKNSRGKKQKANVSIKEKQKKHRPKVKKPKKVGFIERLATPKPRKPRFLLRWSPTGRLFDQKGKIVASSESESQSDCSNGNLKLLINFVWKFMGTIRFKNDHVAAILGFGDLQWGNILITRVYFVEGLGHNLFAMGQFCDSDLEVAFRRNSCFVRNLEGVNLLKGDHSTNLYTINLHKMASASPICLMARASSTKSWLWHQRLSHLNFDTINDLAKNDLVSGLPKFKYHKKHLCPSCEQGKSKRASHPTKPVPNSRQRLHLLRMDLCRPMRIASINRKRYVLVIVDNYSCYTWVHFLRSKDEAPENDREDIGKLGAKGDIGFFIGYSADSCAYRIYNRRKKKIMETMNVSFDEVSVMAFEQRSSKPRLQSMTSGQISSGLDLTYAPSTITSQQLTEGELDLLFEAMYDDYIGGQPSATLRTVPAAQEPQVPQTSTTSTSIADTAPIPTNSSSHATNCAAESSSSQNVDPSNMHTFYQPYPHEFQWTKDHPLEQIESMQEELLQFKRLDVWVSVPAPDNISPLTLKWLFKNKHDEEQTII
nr:integrase, catalytic region, zinc finger, CCHC-type, peptidase aspartic, catalytic [Tanacetum cinerariifolium]GEV08655.1 integrase, catalytic region, zinc finger, CCHC-type, peptidase aspartic, catalytic [Tanacetum cinerariifolium]